MHRSFVRNAYQCLLRGSEWKNLYCRPQALAWQSAAILHGPDPSPLRERNRFGLGCISQEPCRRTPCCKRSPSLHLAATPLLVSLRDHARDLAAPTAFDDALNCYGPLFARGSHSTSASLDAEPAHLTAPGRVGKTSVSQPPLLSNSDFTADTISRAMFIRSDGIDMPSLPPLSLDRST